MDVLIFGVRVSRPLSRRFVDFVLKKYDIVVVGRRDIGKIRVSIIGSNFFSVGNNFLLISRELCSFLLSSYVARYL